MEQNFKQIEEPIIKAEEASAFKALLANKDFIIFRNYVERKLVKDSYLMAKEGDATKFPMISGGVALWRSVMSIMDRVERRDKPEQKKA